MQNYHLLKTDKQRVTFTSLFLHGCDEPGCWSSPGEHLGCGILLYSNNKQNNTFINPIILK